MILHLGIDIGTSGIKTVTIDQAGSTRSFFSVPLKASSGSGKWAEWSLIERCIKEAIKGNIAMLSSEVIDSRAAIKSIGISSVCPSVVGMKKNGDTTTDIILYNDTRSLDEELEIQNRIGDERFFEESKNYIFPGGVSATSIMWLKKHCSEEYSDSDYIGHLSTLLGLSLTGNAAIDPSHASCTGLFKTACVANEWNYAICDELGIDADKLPELVKSNEAIGGLVNRGYIELGLAEGIPVSVGGNDTSCAALAAGAVKAGNLFESCGSTDVLCYVHGSDSDADFPKDFINRKHVVDGLWIANGALSSGGVSLKWFAENYFSGEEDMYEAVEQSAMQSVPGANHMIFLPFMKAERAPFWWKEPKTGFYNGSEGCLCDMSRAVYESSGYGIRLILDKLTSVYSIPSDSAGQILAVGGGTQNLCHMQIKADILQHDYCISEVEYAAAKGAAILGGDASGYIDSKVFVPKTESTVIHHSPSLKAAYDKAYGEFVSLIR